MAPPAFRLPPGATIAQTRRALAAAFAQAGIESAATDARLLIADALHLDHAALVSRGDDAIAPDGIAAIEAVAARRLAREPVARILGLREFWSLPLAVTPAVLVPRPETETVVEYALDLVAAAGRRDQALRVLDIGTGSGALLLALLTELPNASGVATDLSVAALAVARRNAQSLALSPRAAFVATRYADALVGRFDLIVSNPPYIARGDIAGLEPEVRCHDPRLALDGGPDGLDCYRAIAANAGCLLAPGGLMVLELGAGQAAAVAALLAAAGLAPCGPARPDLAGIPRALAASETA